MRRRTRVVSASLLAVTGSCSLFWLLVPGAASAQPPDVAAWWNVANAGNGAPAPPAPPDVSAGDLLIQGSNGAPAAPATVPIGGAPVSSQAVAGLEFDLPSGAIVGALTLAVAGTPPPQENVVACRATRSFFAEENGAWPDVPPSDCSQTVTSTLKGNTVVFADIGKLVQDDSLRIVLLPGAVDRIVFAKPNAGALAVTEPSGVGFSAPPFGAGTNGGVGSGGAVPPPVAGPVGGAPVLPSGPTTGNAAGVPPVVAPSPTPTSVAAAPAASSAGGELTTSQRRLAAGGVIGLELLGFLLLLGDRAAERVAVSSAAGGRLRAPDRATAGGPVTPPARGIGRFSAVRDGPAPRL